MIFAQVLYWVRNAPPGVSDRVNPSFAVQAQASTKIVEIVLLRTTGPLCHRHIFLQDVAPRYHASSLVLLARNLFPDFRSIHRPNHNVHLYSYDSGTNCRILNLESFPKWPLTNQFKNLNQT